MTAPSSLEALADTLGNAALRQEISWQAADRALQLAEASAERLEAEQEQREWQLYLERIAVARPEEWSPEQLWREQQLARAWWLQSIQPGWLGTWQRRLQSLLHERRSA